MVTQDSIFNLTHPPATNPVTVTPAADPQAEPATMPPPQNRLTQTAIDLTQQLQDEAAPTNQAPTGSNKSDYELRLHTKQAITPSLQDQAMPDGEAQDEAQDIEDPEDNTWTRVGGSDEDTTTNHSPRYVTMLINHSDMTPSPPNSSITNSLYIAATTALKAHENGPHFPYLTFSIYDIKRVKGEEKKGRGWQVKCLLTTAPTGNIDAHNDELYSNQVDDFFSQHTLKYHPDQCYTNDLEQCIVKQEEKPNPNPPVSDPNHEFVLSNSYTYPHVVNAPKEQAYGVLIGLVADDHIHETNLPSCSDIANYFVRVLKPIAKLPLETVMFMDDQTLRDFIGFRPATLDAAKHTRHPPKQRKVEVFFVQAPSRATFLKFQQICARSPAPLQYHGLKLRVEEFPPPHQGRVQSQRRHHRHPAADPGGNQSLPHTHHHQAHPQQPPGVG